MSTITIDGASITLICLVKGSSTAFPVDIDRNLLVGHLKKAIKAEKQNDFAGIDADKLRLWKVEISGDRDDIIQNQTLQDSDELLAINDIGDYWTDTPPKKYIHVIIEPRKFFRYPFYLMALIAIVSFSSALYRIC